MKRARYNGIINMKRSSVKEGREKKMDRVYECVEKWMAECKELTVKPATYDRLLTSLALMKKYSIAYESIGNLEAEDINRYLRNLVDDGYAFTTIKKQYHLLGAYLKYAAAEGIIERPIHFNVSLPAQTLVKKKKKEIETYNMVEQTALSKVFSTLERPGYGANLLMMETGIRVGEALALMWGDVDWNRKAIKINKTVIRIANTRISRVQDSPKSSASKRVLPLSKKALGTLQELYLSASDRNGFVFVGEDNKHLTYEALRYQTNLACEKAKVPYKGQHVFRHTFATNCYYKGCDVKILSKMLGHSSVSVTFNTYIHLFGDALDEMRAIVD